MLEALQEEQMGPESRVVALRKALAPLEKDAKLSHLSEGASEVDIMRCLVEMGAGIADGKGVTGTDLRALAVASTFMSPQHREFLLRQVRAEAYNPKSVLRKDALAALAQNGDVSASHILKAEAAEDRERQENLFGGTATQIRGCCEGH